MSKGTEFMGDIFAEEEAKRLAEGRAEIAAEKAAWEALSQAERDRISKERADRYEEMFELAQEGEEDEDEQDEEDEA